MRKRRPPHDDEPTNVIPFPRGGRRSEFGRRMDKVFDRPPSDDAGLPSHLQRGPFTAYGEDPHAVLDRLVSELKGDGSDPAAIPVRNVLAVEFDEPAQAFASAFNAFREKDPDAVVLTLASVNADGEPEMIRYYYSGMNQLELIGFLHQLQKLLP